MQDIWIESFYNETDAEKRQAFLKEHTGDPKDELDEFREKLWIARYGKRKPKNDAFVGLSDADEIYRRRWWHEPWRTEKKAGCGSSRQVYSSEAMTIWISRSRRWYSMR